MPTPRVHLTCTPASRQFATALMAGFLDQIAARLTTDAQAVATAMDCD
ncbi:MAG: hypothetical protein JJU27_17615 [Gammaproteobacteria bacterium]|nr:hypothetical protein [Gammaproteobacteria bacterium]